MKFIKYRFVKKRVVFKLREKIHILQTKITPPTVKEQILRRPSLFKKMKAISFYPLTIVHSGPGYGKSTALASFIQDHQSAFCWYSISNNDDIIPFLTYITYSIKKNYPDFGEEILLYAESMDRYIRVEEIRTLASIFINEVIRLKEEVVLIIDDFHLVQQSSAIDEWIQWLLQHIPKNIHLVLSSRTKPSWQILTAMKVKGELLEIKQTDLMFSKEEIDVLVNDYYNFNLTDNEIEQIFTITEGWVIAIGMIWQQLKSKGEVDKILHNKSGSLDDLFRFLTMEVFMKQPPMVQQFLEQTCIFDELTGTLCDYVLGISNSESMLTSLSNQNLFLVSIGEGQYRYHALFKEFLESQLRINKQQAIFLHQRGARYYERNGLFDQAIHHLEAIDAYGDVAEILHQHGQTMVRNGQLESLLERLKKISGQEKDHYYMLWHYQGEVYRYRCSYEEAENCYKKAIEKANSAGDYLGESRALEGQAQIYLDTIQPKKAERILLAAINVLEKNEKASEKDKSRLYRLMAENLANAGQALKAEKWYEKGKELLVPLTDGNLEARLYLRTGRLLEARKILLQKNQNVHNEQEVNLQQSHRETDLLLSLIEAFVGNGEEAKKLAHSGIQQGVRFQAPFVEACGWIRMGHAVQLFEKYNGSFARECYETALEIMEELNVSRGKAEPLMGLCLLYGNEGVFERAIEYGQKALEETEKVDDSWLSALIQLCMSIAAVHNEKWQDAQSFLIKAEKMFVYCGDQFGALLTELWKSFVYYECSMRDEFTTSMSEFLRQIQVGNFEFILQKSTTFGPRDLQSIAPLLLEANKRGIHRQYTNYLLTELGFSNLTSHPGYTLRIKTLGSFRVWLGNEEIGEKDWHRGKAKELLELFVTKRNMFLSKEEIFALLWPESDEKTAVRDFKVALNALNNALEPTRKARATPFFIQREGAAYGLNPQAAYQLDTREFEQWVQAGLEERDQNQAIHYLKKGLMLYKGDFLPHRRYDDWCLNERERLQVYFLRATERLAQASVQTENYPQAIHWCEQILMKDCTWEEAYRLLMFSYYKQNNRPQAMKWYNKCCEELEAELGVTPMEATIQVYEMIIGSGRTIHLGK